MRKHGWFVIAGILALNLAIWGCGGSEKNVVSSRAYKGHATDQDILNFVKQYPKTVGTRLDDCQTCHASGTITISNKDTFKNACDYCHYIEYPDTTTSIALGAPSSFADTLNLYGKDYLDQGRTQKSIKDIGSLDSDGDGSANEVEIAALRYPGDSSSNPGQQVAPIKIVSLDELKAMPSHSEFLLANASKQQFDTYASYQGVKIQDFLTALGVDLTQVTGITVIAPDGFTKDFDVKYITAAYPSALYYAGLDTATMPTGCGFVEYPAAIPAGLTDGAAIPDEQWLMLAYEREGAPMEASYLDPAAGKINGEGPLRIIVPQATPGSPDRGSGYATTCNDGYEYDKNKDHNAGSMVRGVMAIRINPMPAGHEDFDYTNGGWAYIDAEQLVVYGFGITQ
ncbi:MAG: hypothetical protein NT009_14020 [Proteobacteria bacterium]|nr:hypothetical protein [Pseudomonadota bacterium]